MSEMRVFLSHSSQDKAFADALVKALRLAGADVWYDEHNLGTGQLLDVITSELQARPVFVVLLSKAAFASDWVRRECKWAFNLHDREPKRSILPVVVSTIDRSDFNAMLFLEDFKRIVGPRDRPYPQAAAIERTLRQLGLTRVEPRGGDDETLPSLGRSLDTMMPHPFRPPMRVQDFLEKDTRDHLGRLKATGPGAGSHDDANRDRRVTSPPIDSEGPEGPIARGKRLLALGQYESAISTFQRAAALRRESFDAWFGLGQAYIKVQKWQQALQAWEQAVAISPNASFAWYYKGTTLAKLQRYVEALAAYEHALALNPGYVAAWNERAEVLHELGRLGEELAACDRVLALDPSNVRARDSRDSVLHKVVHSGDELAAYDRALASDPEDRGPLAADLWTSKGQALAQAGRHEEALACYQRALKLAPRNVQALRNQAVSLFALGRDAEAEEAEVRVKLLGG